MLAWNIKEEDQTVKYYFRTGNISMVQNICMKVQSIRTEMKAEYLRMAAFYVHCGNQLITILNCVLIYEVCSQYTSWNEGINFFKSTQTFRIFVKTLGLGSTGGEYG